MTGAGTGIVRGERRRGRRGLLAPAARHLTAA